MDQSHPLDPTLKASKASGPPTIRLLIMINPDIEQMVHKMVHAVTAYPSIHLKLSVLRVFVLKFDNLCIKSIRVSSTEMV